MGNQNLELLIPLVLQLVIKPMPTELNGKILTDFSGYWIRPFMEQLHFDIQPNG